MIARVPAAAGRRAWSPTTSAAAAPRSVRSPTTTPTSVPVEPDVGVGERRGADRRAITATDFDPQGDPPEENPELAALAVDGDPDTAWHTQTYDQNFGPGGLKTGVGLILDLGATHDVARRRPHPGRLAHRRRPLYVTDTRADRRPRPDAGRDRDRRRHPSADRARSGRRRAATSRSG